MALSWKLRYMGHSYDGNQWPDLEYLPLCEETVAKPCHGYSGRPKAMTIEECIYENIKTELPLNTPEKWINLIVFGGEEIFSASELYDIPLSAQGACQNYTMQKVYCEQCDYAWFNLIGGETGCVYFEDGFEFCPVCGGSTDGIEYAIVRKSFYPNYYKKQRNVLNAKTI